MWTIIYTDSYGNEHYDRFTKDELYNFIVNNQLENDEDLLIFPPDTELDVFGFFNMC